MTAHLDVGDGILVKDTLTLYDFIQENYDKLEWTENKPDFELYKRGLVGYLNLKENHKLGNSKLITLIDFRLSSNRKRIWIVDLGQNKVVYHNLVAHGRNTGNEYAKNFSNRPNSNQSSLGFFVTGENYIGKHGVSLRLDGAEEGYNHNARQRAVVMHSAAYVDKSYTREYGRIGRSFGCPAIPIKGHKEILKKIANKSCLFIYYPDEKYLSGTKLQDEEKAIEFLQKQDFKL